MPTIAGLPTGSLKKLRASAPRQDRNDLALQPSRPSSRSRHATTLEELGQSCGEYGHAAVVRARWSAIKRWLMEPDCCLSFSNPSEVVAESVLLCSEAADYQSKLPQPEGKPHDPILFKISRESRAEARRVASETFEDWKAAGRPFLTAANIGRTHQYILACIRRLELERAS